MTCVSALHFMSHFVSHTAHRKPTTLEPTHPGKAKTIKLISLKQNVVYRYLTGHRGELNDLRFLRTEPTQLLSAASDGAVYLWDIGAGFDTDVGGR